MTPREEAEQQEELATLRSQVERLEKERDEAKTNLHLCWQQILLAQQQGFKIPTIAELMDAALSSQQPEGTGKDG